jgi:pimeloyl-ACP methyl ester carboxylesterase
MARLSARLRRARWIALKRMYADPAKLTPETIAGYSRMMDIPGTLDYCLAIVKTWRRDMAQLKPRLESIRLPVLLIWGSLDGAVPPASGRELAAHLQHPELAIMPGAGHMPYEEAPAEFNCLVLNFLDQRNETTIS